MTQQSVRLGKRVAGSSLIADKVIEQDTLAAAEYWFNPGQPLQILLKHC